MSDGLDRLDRTAGRGHEGASVAASFVRALQAMLRHDDADAGRHWQRCLSELPRIGGSHAQRAVVETTHAAGRLAMADHLS